jgi:hypothetical protein
VIDGEAPTVVVDGDAPVEVSVDPSADEVGSVKGSVALVALVVPGLLCVALVEVPVVPDEAALLASVAPEAAFICADDIPLRGDAVVEPVWACAAPDAATHNMVARMNGRCIALSLSLREQNAWRSTAFPG